MNLRNSRDLTRRSTWRKASLWVITILASSIITLTVKDWWEAPRARVEVAKLDFRQPSLSSFINLDHELVSRIERHFYFPNLDASSSLEDVEAALETGKENTETFRRASAHLREIIERVKTQSPNLRKDSRRREFLKLLQDRPSEQSIILRIADTVADSFDLPESYTSHPPGEEDLRVSLPNSVADLSEVNEEQFYSQILESTGDPNMALQESWWMA